MDGTQAEGRRDNSSGVRYLGDSVARSAAASITTTSDVSTDYVANLRITGPAF
jgi:hypothetical protein